MAPRCSCHLSWDGNGSLTSHLDNDLKEEGAGSGSLEGAVALSHNRAGRGVVAEMARGGRRTATCAG